MPQLRSKGLIPADIARAARLNLIVDKSAGFRDIRKTGNQRETRSPPPVNFCISTERV